MRFALALVAVVLTRSPRAHTYAACGAATRCDEYQLREGGAALGPRWGRAEPSLGRRRDSPAEIGSEHRLTPTATLLTRTKPFGRTPLRVSGEQRTRLPAAA